MKSNSLRLRLLRSEVAKLLETGRIEESVHLGPTSESTLTYALETVATLPTPSLRHTPSEIAILLPIEDANIWATSERQVGIYASLDIAPNGTLDLIVEKDFACLDLSDADNADTFPNPEAGAVC